MMLTDTSTAITYITWRWRASKRCAVAMPPHAPSHCECRWASPKANARHWQCSRPLERSMRVASVGRCGWAKSKTHVFKTVGRAPAAARATTWRLPRFTPWLRGVGCACSNLVCNATHAGSDKWRRSNSRCSWGAAIGVWATCDRSALVLPLAVPFRPLYSACDRDGV